MEGYYDFDYMNLMTLLMPLILVVAIVIEVYMIVLIVKLARRKGESGGLWVVISLFIGWLFTIIILLCVGNSNEKELKKKKKTVVDGFWICPNCKKKNTSAYEYCGWCYNKKPKN